MAVVLLLVITIYVTKYVSDGFAMYLIIVPIIIFVFNFTVRNLKSFKPYFLSPYNFLSGKTLIEKELELPKDILVEKFQEVLIEAGFKVKDVDKAAGTIFATLGLSWKTWGDNIYIEFNENGKSKFYSVSVVGVYSWGKNDCNLRNLANSFESSLII